MLMEYSSQANLKGEGEELQTSSYALLQRLLRMMAFDDKEKFDGAQIPEAQLRNMFDRNIKKLDAKMVPEDKETIFQALVAELYGYGPLQSLFEDPEVSDILVNGPEDVWIDRNGQMHRTDIRFENEAHLMRVLMRMVVNRGKQLNELCPYVDLQLEDGSRLHALIPPVVAHPTIAFRRCFKELFPLELLCTNGSIPREIATYLIEAVQSGVNILISGGASAGKTTLLNALAAHIPKEERVVTIEQTKELRIDHSHVVSLEGQSSNSEGVGEISLQSLLRSALRLRADRIIVGEVRGLEVFEMIQSMNVGHRGSLATIHANSPKDALRRLEMLTLMSGAQISSEVAREFVYSGIDLVVQVKRSLNGSRRLTHVFEIHEGAQGRELREVYQLEDVSKTHSEKDNPESENNFPENETATL